MNADIYNSSTLLASSAIQMAGSVTGGSTLDLGGGEQARSLCWLRPAKLSEPGHYYAGCRFWSGGGLERLRTLDRPALIVLQINETAYTNYQDYVSTTIGSEFLYTVTSDIALNAGASYSLLNYTPVPGNPGGAFAHSDNSIARRSGCCIPCIHSFKSVRCTNLPQVMVPIRRRARNYTRHIIMLRIVARR